jgi:hypothetical protein
MWKGSRPTPLSGSVPPEETWHLVSRSFCGLGLAPPVVPMIRRSPATCCCALRVSARRPSRVKPCRSQGLLSLRVPAAPCCRTGRAASPPAPPPSDWPGRGRSADGASHRWMTSHPAKVVPASRLQTVVRPARRPRAAPCGEPGRASSLSALEHPYGRPRLTAHGA